MLCSNHVWFNRQQVNTEKAEIATRRIRLHTFILTIWSTFYSTEENFYSAPSINCSPTLLPSKLEDMVIFYSILLVCHITYIIYICFLFPHTYPSRGCFCSTFDPVIQELRKNRFKYLHIYPYISILYVCVYTQFSPYTYH